MSLSKRYLAKNLAPTTFSLEELAALLKEALPNIQFAYLYGSASQGTIKPQSDLDLALFYGKKLSVNEKLSTYIEVSEIIEKFIPSVRVDLGCLNNCDPIYGFEVIKGKLLFQRNEEAWLNFYSVTCRLYESYTFHYEKQQKLRVEVNKHKKHLPKLSDNYSIKK